MEDPSAAGLAGRASRVGAPVPCARHDMPGLPGLEAQPGPVPATIFGGCRAAPPAARPLGTQRPPRAGAGAGARAPASGREGERPGTNAREPAFDLCRDAADPAEGLPRSRAGARPRGRARDGGAATDPACDLLIGASPAIATLRDTVRQVAPSDATVLVTGPTGAGKENVARALHLLSARATCPFVAINCGAIPGELAEAELFGAEAGAYTGAARARPGLIAGAHGGTLFLDELGELSPMLQVKLLRVIETREVTRLGGTRPQRIDVRIVAATNRNLADEVAAGRFRADLYWRLAVVLLEVPPLAARPGDVPVLLAHFSARQGLRLRLTPCGAARLEAHGWPGNVRELRNLVDRASALGVDTLSAESLDRLLAPHGRAQPQAALPDPWPRIAGAPAPRREGPLPRPFADAQPLEPVALKALLREAEAALIAQALDAAGGTVAGAGRMLGLKRTTLVEKMKRMGLRPPANEAA